MEPSQIFRDSAQKTHYNTQTDCTVYSRESLQNSRVDTLHPLVTTALSLLNGRHGLFDRRRKVVDVLAGSLGLGGKIVGSLCHLR